MRNLLVLFSSILLTLTTSSCSTTSTKPAKANKAEFPKIVVTEEKEPTSGEIIKEFTLKFTDKDIQASNPTPVVKFATNFGDVYAVLDRKNSPITVDKFLSYTVEKRYDNTIFQRVINNFLIQGGAYYTDMSSVPDHGPIPTESGNGLTHQKYSLGLAMWRRHTGTHHFYFNMKENFYLDPNETRWGVTIFGKVIQGFDVLDKIQTVKTNEIKEMFLQDTPIEQVIIHKLTLLSENEGKALLAKIKK